VSGERALIGERLRAHARARRKEIRSNQLKFLDSRSGKQRRAVRGIGNRSNWHRQASDRSSFGKGYYVCSPYVPVKPALSVVPEAGYEINQIYPARVASRRLPVLSQP
jgi:hypothetical protein